MGSERELWNVPEIGPSGKLLDRSDAGLMGEAGAAQTCMRAAAAPRGVGSWAQTRTPRFQSCRPLAGCVASGVTPSLGLVSFLRKGGQ